MVQKTVKIGTRGSKLALYQAFLVQEGLQKEFPNTNFSIEIIKTKGDQILDVALSKIGDKGLFTKEMETALFNGEIDMAVHSLKDLPTKFPEGAKLGAVLKRGDIRDALVTLDGRKIKDLTSNDIIATSSLRRKAQLLRINKEFQIIEIRGNVNTRIRKMQEGYCTAMVMAGAGLQRLEMGEHISEFFEPELMIPACSQGAIAVEIRINDAEIENLVAKINDQTTYQATEAERAFLGTLEGGCQIPVGSYTKIDGDNFEITGFISSIDGTKYLQKTANGSLAQATFLAAKLANDLFKSGGSEILTEIRIKTAQDPHAELPLKEKVIISTRALEASDTLPSIIQASGAKVISFPMIEIIPAPLTDQLKNTFENLNQFDWVFFTSKNGVVNFFKQLIDVKGSSDLPATLKLAVIGYKTALELEYYGYAPTFISAENTAEELINRFCATINPRDLSILLSLGNLADNTLEDRLKKENKVSRINVYQTVKPSQVDPQTLAIIKNNQYDLIVFTSPSTYHHYCEVAGADGLKELKMASIGSITTKAIQKSGFEPLFTAQKSNAEGIRDAILDYFKS